MIDLYGFFMNIESRADRVSPHTGILNPSAFVALLVFSILVKLICKLSMPFEQVR